MKPMPIRISELAHTSYASKPLSELKPKMTRNLNPEPPKDLAENIKAENIKTSMQIRDKEIELLERQARSLNKTSDEKYAEKMADMQRRIEELKEQNRLDKSALIGIWNNRLDIFA